MYYIPGHLCLRMYKSCTDRTGKRERGREGGGRAAPAVRKDEKSSKPEAPGRLARLRGLWGLRVVGWLVRDGNRYGTTFTHRFDGVDHGPFKLPPRRADTHPDTFRSDWGNHIARLFVHFIGAAAGGSGRKRWRYIFSRYVHMYLSRTVAVCAYASTETNISRLPTAPTCGGGFCGRDIAASEGDTCRRCYWSGRRKQSDWGSGALSRRTPSRRSPRHWARAVCRYVSY